LSPLLETPTLVIFDFPARKAGGEEQALALRALAEDIAAEPDLLWKIWTEDKEAGRSGGIYLFRNRAAAEAYHAKGIRCSDPGELDAKIQEMIDYPGPVIFDCVVAKEENCLPMIPSGKPHNEMILPDFAGDIGNVIDAKGRGLV
jgi:hypothetical protein